MMEDLSKLRQKISQVNKKREALLQKIMKTEPFLAAQVYERFKKCGNKTCKCARGELHGPFVWLYQKKKGQKLLSTSVPKDFAKEAKELAENYKILLENRKKVREADSEINILLNQMEEILERDAVKYVTKEKGDQKKSKSSKASTEEQED